MPGKETRGYGCTIAQFLLVALTVVGGAKADVISVIDQQNPGPAGGSQGGVVFGQSFTPTLSRIDFFEVEIGDFGAIDEVQILNGVSGGDGGERPATCSIPISGRHCTNTGRHLRCTDLLHQRNSCSQNCGNQHHSRQRICRRPTVGGRVFGDIAFFGQLRCGVPGGIDQRAGGSQYMGGCERPGDYCWDAFSDD